jgi:hypothetical protein
MSNDGLPRPENAFDEKLVSDVRAYGWHSVLVGAEGGADPPYAYTVGLFHSYRHPELVLVGPWRYAHGILGAAVELVGDGATLAAGDESDDVLEGYPVRFGPVNDERRDELLTHAAWLYGGRPFPALQVILPDGAGRMPDDTGYDGYPQPLLG